VDFLAALVFWEPNLEVMLDIATMKLQDLQLVERGKDTLINS
jgi:hypothetical protein